MPFFLNPFKKHDLDDFPDAFVPLERARHRSSIVSNNRRLSLIQSSAPPADHDEKSSRKDSDARSGTASVQPGYTVGLTVDSLRAEIEGDLAAADSKSAYDRKSMRDLISFTKATSLEIACVILDTDNCRQG